MPRRRPAWPVRQYALQVAFVSLALALVYSALFFALAALSLRTDAARIRAHIAEAFATGELVDENYLDIGDSRGVHQLNDCLIFGMALDRSAPPLQLIVSPIKTTVAGVGPFDKCAILKSYVAGAQPIEPPRFYHRYLHGHRALASFLLQSLGVHDLRRLLLWSDYGTLAAIFALALGRVATKAATGADGERTFEAPLCIAAIAMTFALFDGIDAFGMSISHAPSDLVAFTFLGSALFVDYARMPFRAFALAIGSFGALSAYLELLTGPIPLGAAMVVGLIGIQARPPLAPSALRGRVITGLAIFLSTAFLCFAIKIAVATAIFGQSTLTDFAEQLDYRLGPGTAALPATLPSVVRRLAGATGYIAWGSRPLGLLVVSTSLAIGAVYLWRLVRPSAEPFDRAKGAALLASLCVPFAWYMILRQHTVEHAWFMVRLMAWPIAIGFAAPLVYQFRSGVQDMDRARLEGDAHQLNDAAAAHIESR